MDLYETIEVIVLKIEGNLKKEEKYIEEAMGINEENLKKKEGHIEEAMEINEEKNLYKFIKEWKKEIKMEKHLTILNKKLGKLKKVRDRYDNSYRWIKNVDKGPLYMYVPILTVGGVNGFISLIISALLCLALENKKVNLNREFRKGKLPL